MTHQYPGPQQPYQQPYQGPTPYQPPPPPKKGMSAWAIVGITLGGIFAFVLVLGVIGAIAGDGTGSASDTAVAVTDSPTVSHEIKAPAPSKAAVKPAPKPKPAAPRAPEYSDGDYVVGEDIPPGTYATNGAQKGLFEFCSVTTKPTSEGTWPQIKSANADERIIITLKKSDGVVTISGCEPLTRR